MPDSMYNDMRERSQFMSIYVSSPCTNLEYSVCVQWRILSGKIPTGRLVPKAGIQTVCKQAVTAV